LDKTKAHVLNLKLTLINWYSHFLHIVVQMSFTHQVKHEMKKRMSNPDQIHQQLPFHYPNCHPSLVIHNLEAVPQNAVS